MNYRMAINASVCVDITAANDAEAIMKAKEIADANEGGLPLRGGDLRRVDARLYFFPSGEIDITVENREDD